MRLKDFLDYIPVTGDFTWIKPRKGIRKTREAGRVDGNGYRTICLDYKHYLAHRLAWWFYYGDWPEGNIDHIDGDKLNNSITNLRIATVRQNGANLLKYHKGTSKYKGVGWHKRDKKWRAYISNQHIGYFESEEGAARAYDARAVEEYGDFAKTNF
jgi:hypothetical protein